MEMVELFNILNSLCVHGFQACSLSQCFEQSLKSLKIYTSMFIYLTKELRNVKTYVLNKPLTQLKMSKVAKMLKHVKIFFGLRCV